MCSMRYVAKIKKYQDFSIFSSKFPDEKLIYFCVQNIIVAQPAWNAGGYKSCFDYWFLLPCWVFLGPFESFLAPWGSLCMLYIQVEVLHKQWLLWLLLLHLQWLLAVSLKISETYLYFCICFHTSSVCCRYLELIFQCVEWGLARSGAKRSVQRRPSCSASTGW